MMALETVNNAYLGGDSSLACSDDTAADIDKEVHRIINDAHDKARQIVTDNLDKMHETTRYLLEKETITGEEFMRILNSEEQVKALDSAGNRGDENSGNGNRCNENNGSDNKVQEV